MIRKLIERAVDRRVDEIIEKFCPHAEWKAVGSIYNPPAPRAHMRNIDEEYLLLLVYGFTTITQRCTQCGKITVIERTGRVHVPGLVSVS